MKRKCNVCKKEKDISAFSEFTYDTKKDGVKISRRRTCIECITNRYDRYEETLKVYLENNKEKIATYYKERRKDKEFLLRIKVKAKTRTRKHKSMAVKFYNGVCARCGCTGPDCIFDFHHIDPALKESTIGSLLTHSWEKIKAELIKCVMLCSNCHRIVHSEEQQE